MSIESTMSVVMAYYNSRLALWEPLIEPMEAMKNGERTSTPWELRTKVRLYWIINLANITSNQNISELHDLSILITIIISIMYILLGTIP